MRNILLSNKQDNGKSVALKTRTTNVVKNAGCARSRYTLKSSLMETIFALFPFGLHGDILCLVFRCWWFFLKLNCHH